jgi:catechol 2,3-dioxygenase-like lactoylglutathione lyase family enzyme
VTTQKANPYFDLKGLSHIALMCSDMAQTVDFYEGVLGMPLVKTMEAGAGGQHFFFDIGNGDLMAFVYAPGAPASVPGISNPAEMGTCAVGGMAHFAIQVDPERFTEYRSKLEDKGIKYWYIAHDVDGSLILDPNVGVNDNTFAECVYFKDPDGIVLEFCAWRQPAYDRVQADMPAIRASELEASDDAKVELRIDNLAQVEV